MSHLCTGDQPALSKAAVLAGARSLLNTMGLEDVMGDAPKAADWVTITSCLHTSLSQQAVKQVWSALTCICARHDTGFHSICKIISLKRHFFCMWFDILLVIAMSVCCASVSRCPLHCADIAAGRAL